MEDFTALDCGCYVGFDVHHKPMWGKQCSLHKSAPDMYEALKLYQKHQEGTGGHFCGKCAVAINLAVEKAEGK